MDVVQYHLHHDEMAPQTYYNNNINRFYDINVGATSTCKRHVTATNHNTKLMIDELTAGRPVVVSGRKINNGTDHFVLVVAYQGNGTRNSDFIVIDPISEIRFPTTYDEFKDRYPDNSGQFPKYNYVMFTFKL